MSLCLPPHPAWIALQFLTRLPIELADKPSAQQQGQSLLWYPLIGLLIGGLLMGGACALQGLPSLLAAAVLLALWVWITGGLHLDGLADCADAWVGGQGDRARSLAIMKDPAAGPIAVIWLVVVLLLKFVSLQLVLQSQQWIYLLIVPVLGRVGAVCLFLSTPYLRTAGLGSAMAKHTPHSSLRGICLFTIAIMLLMLPWQAMLVVLMLAAQFAYLRHLTMQRLGGFTGDVAGAVLELIETTSIVAFAGLISLL